jgi:hypothetical protein
MEGKIKITDKKGESTPDKNNTPSKDLILHKELAKSGDITGLNNKKQDIQNQVENEYKDNNLSPTVIGAIAKIRSMQYNNSLSRTETHTKETKTQKKADNLPYDHTSMSNTTEALTLVTSETSPTFLEHHEIDEENLTKDIIKIREIIEEMQKDIPAIDEIKKRNLEKYIKSTENLNTALPELLRQYNPEISDNLDTAEKATQAINKIIDNICETEEIPSKEELLESIRSTIKEVTPPDEKQNKEGPALEITEYSLKVIHNRSIDNILLADAFTLIILYPKDVLKDTYKMSTFLTGARDAYNLVNTIINQAPDTIPDNSSIYTLQNKLCQIKNIIDKYSINDTYLYCDVKTTESKEYSRNHQITNLINRINHQQSEHSFSHAELANIKFQLGKLDHQESIIQENTEKLKAIGTLAKQKYKEISNFRDDVINIKKEVGDTNDSLSVHLESLQYSLQALDDYYNGTDKNIQNVIIGLQQMKYSLQFLGNFPMMHKLHNKIDEITEPLGNKHDLKRWSDLFTSDFQNPPKPITTPEIVFSYNDHLNKQSNPEPQQMENQIPTTTSSQPETGSFYTAPSEINTDLLTVFSCKSVESLQSIISFASSAVYNTLAGLEKIKFYPPDKQKEYLNTNTISDENTPAHSYKEIFEKKIAQVQKDTEKYKRMAEEQKNYPDEGQLLTYRTNRANIAQEKLNLLQDAFSDTLQIEILKRHIHSGQEQTTIDIETTEALIQQTEALSQRLWRLAKHYEKLTSFFDLEGNTDSYGWAKSIAPDNPYTLSSVNRSAHTPWRDERIQRKAKKVYNPKEVKEEIEKMIEETFEEPQPPKKGQKDYQEHLHTYNETIKKRTVNSLTEEDREAMYKSLEEDFLASAAHELGEGLYAETERIQEKANRCNILAKEFQILTEYRRNASLLEPKEAQELTKTLETEREQKINKAKEHTTALQEIKYKIKQEKDHLHPSMISKSENIRLTEFYRNKNAKGQEEDDNNIRLISDDLEDLRIKDKG